MGFKWSPGCNCCGRACDQCTTTPPAQYDVAVSGTINWNDCADCADLDGTYRVTQLASPGDPCIHSASFSSSSCGEMLGVRVRHQADIGNGNWIQVDLDFDGPGPLVGTSSFTVIAYGEDHSSPPGNAEVSPDIPEDGSGYNCNQTFTITMISRLDSVPFGTEEECTLPIGATITLTPV